MLSNDYHGPLPDSESEKIMKRAIDKGLEVKAVIREIKEISEEENLGPDDPEKNDRDNRLKVLKGKQERLVTEVRLLRRLKEFEDSMNEPTGSACVDGGFGRMNPDGTTTYTGDPKI